MDWIRGPFLHKGKAKSVYSIQKNSDFLWMEFTDDLTAFNGKKQSSFPGKGFCNRDISSQIFRFLKTEHVENHWVADQDRRIMICQKLEMLPVEVVVRNRMAGSTAQRFHLPEGKILAKPLVEFYYKNDELNDPFISSEQALAFGYLRSWGGSVCLKTPGFNCEYKIKMFFAKVGIDLIDFKLEFGKRDNHFILGDEISCDSCRLWDTESGEKLDKDRFRQDLGRIKESYQKVHHLLKQSYP